MVPTVALWVSVSAGAPTAPTVVLPARVRRIVLHVPGSPAYDRPDRRFAFFTPPQTQRMWKPHFGTHWIVWTDGSIWPRHVPSGEPSFVPPVDRPAEEVLRSRVVGDAAPVYAHVQGYNQRSLGIEVAHTGRSGDPFPPVQIRSLAWLLRTLMETSGGRLGPASILGHKDLDPRPAYVYRNCQRPGCPVYVDELGAALRRRVDPPETLFRALAAEGLSIPRPPGATDADLLRAEAFANGGRPRVERR